MTWSPGPVVTRRRLGGELKRLREGRGLKLEDVARRLECSPSKISRLENGKGVPRWRDVRDMLEVYGVPDGDERDRLLDWARDGPGAGCGGRTTPTSSPPAWRPTSSTSGTPRGSTPTRRTSSTACCRPATTRAGCCDRAWGRIARRAQIERLVEVRMRRQEALDADHGLTFRCVLDESTLYRVVGSTRRAARAQVEHLIEIAEAEHVDVRVLPFAAGLVPASRGVVREAASSRRASSTASSTSSGRGRRASSWPTRRRSRCTSAASRASSTASLPEDESVPLHEARRFGASADA